MNNALDFIDKQITERAERVLDEIGIDVETVVKMTLKRIVKEKSISFITQSSCDIPTKNNAQKDENNMISNNTSKKIKMTKSKAIYLFRNEGTVFNSNVTFSSKNKSADRYWANPAFRILDTDWYLILNDWLNNEVHLFYIPARDISPYDLVGRSDLQNLIDLQIMYDDISFTDTRSKISFSKYYVKSINY